MTRFFMIFFVVLFALLPLQATRSQGGALPAGAPVTASLDFKSSAELARYFSHILAHLPARAFPTLHTQQDLIDWENEIVPYFAYEQVVDPTREVGGYMGLQYPSSLAFAYYQDGEEHNHVLGKTNCLGDVAVTINARYANPDTPFYTRHDALLTLVHELAHAQGICYSNVSYDAENSAQLVALEVLAAMVNKGNALAFGPLVNELRDMSLASALYFARKENRVDDFLALVREATGSGVSVATNEQSLRYWASDPDELQHILEAYNVVPLGAIVANVRSTSCFYEPREYPVTHIRFTASACIHGVFLPINGHVFGQPLFIDDLAYVWNHVEGLKEGFYG